ncbi:Carnitine O-palmitoyltransferase 2, mitochondrial [Aphelenchoides besseyi]|nr:Carnitine O-palmitoyltransferase 2, mitochondrial [Aphelenchoides besseyi]KAI6222805.1 Carnitine O-palmitoyltransferase 2, mitochondrial [Aphelenchoides besseyi]
MMQRRIIQKLTVNGHRTNFVIQNRLASHLTLDPNSSDYQFLHRSYIPTYHFQKSLRRLPIPKLEDSCKRFLSAVQAVGTDQMIDEARKTVEELRNGDGPELQRLLIEYDNANSQTSYISEPWFAMYLESRLPCPINFNPFMMLAPDPRSQFNDQLTRATNFVVSCARFKKSLDNEVLEPEVFHLNPKKSNTKFFRRFCRLLPENVSWFGAAALKAFPLDMSQYTSLFGGNRIPEEGKDRLHHVAKPRHVLVIRNGNFYTIDVFGEDGMIKTPQEIHACLAKVLSDSEASAQPNTCIGSLTTMERNAWAKTRREILAQSRRNVESFKQIDDALFALCLDDEKFTEYSEWANNLLCGGDGRNRWFDKCFQLIIDANGQATINFEHSWGDGVAVLRLVEETYKDTCMNNFVRPDQEPAGQTDGLKKLEFDLTDSLKTTISNAQTEHLKRAKEVNFATVEYPRLNRDAIKKAALSPDSVMQVAIQLAFHRTCGTFAPTYESCSTAAFKKGRTECIRSATLATREAVLQLEKEGINDKSTLRTLFKRCSDQHSILVKEAAMGQGFDRHLLGLKITAERQNRPLPSLFTSAVYKRMSEFVVSTSTLTTETIVFGGFAPVVRDGFGIGYNVVGSKLGAVISTYEGQRDAKKFAENLEESLDTIRTCLEN